MTKRVKKVGVYKPVKIDSLETSDKVQAFFTSHYLIMPASLSALNDNAFNNL